jgi:hypothetical protein
MRHVGEPCQGRLLSWLRHVCDAVPTNIVLSGLVLGFLPGVLLGSEQQPAGPDAVARQTVAAALGINETEARVISREPRDFADGSLDCPQPGTAYAQVITPGFRILVEANGRRFDVRVAGTGGRICYRRKPLAEQPAEDSIRPQELGEAARQDLAQRLGVLPQTVTVTDLRRLKPGDTLPGCGEACARDDAASACGVRVRLRVGEQDFDYLALSTGVQPCPDIAAR